MTDAKYTTTLQPISVYGYRVATVTVLEAGTAATTVKFNRPVKVLAKLAESTVTAVESPSATAAQIPGTAKAGDKLYFLVQ
jgi:hypothetical protein